MPKRELFNRQGDALMMIYRLSGRVPEWRLARQHLPERHARRVEIRTDVYARSRELLGTGEFRCPAKTPGSEIAASECDSATAFASPRSIIFAFGPPPSSKLTMMWLV